MTTAHRPTWQAAKGGEEQGGQRIFAPSRQTSAKDAASHTQLKFRSVILLTVYASHGENESLTLAWCGQAVRPAN